MPTIISGDGTITGLTATGISAVQQLPSGSVLQVVQGTYSTRATTTSTTFADTGLSTSITPKFATSKILCIVDLNGCGKTGGNGNIRLQLVRNSTTISNFEGVAGNTSSTAVNFFGNSGISYLDSPATTSATTYKVQFACDNAGTALINESTSSASMSQITLMEIAG